MAPANDMAARIPRGAGDGAAPAAVGEALADARRRTLDLVSDLSDEQLLGPKLAIINPLIWEIGHVAWFQERWVLRHACGRAPVRADGDALYDSSAVAHHTRWDLPLPSRARTLDYMARILDLVQETLARRGDDPKVLYFATYALFHEDMHDEAFTYTRQTLGYPAPPFAAAAVLEPAAAPDPDGDACIQGGTFHLGAAPGDGFVFDNEKWAHPVEVAPFRLARRAVTLGELAAFVDDGGYRRPDLWSAEGWRWRSDAGAEHPLYWRKGADGWERRRFDSWLPLDEHRTAIHLNFFEAESYCRWARRRLPTEAEWELAAAATPDDLGRKRRYPWGDEPPTAARASFDTAGDVIDASALPEGDSAFGCRQMLGTAWEWTSSSFRPFPGFVADAYVDYSLPWFGTHNVLRGGAWSSRSRLLRNTFRTYYTPDRRDVWSGLRTADDA